MCSLQQAHVLVLRLWMKVARPACLGRAERVVVVAAVVDLLETFHLLVVVDSLSARTAPEAVSI